METEPISSFQFPTGFRFHPSDEELIVHYLLNKVKSLPLPAAVIAEVELYNYNPWDLPKKALFGEDEWYFFSPRDRKYPNGARPNRTAASGYWKATGTDKPILTSSGFKKIGVKKALVFYTGRPPKGVKTDWIMNEYRLPDTMSRPSSLRGSMRLDDWVLCRVRQKGNMSKNTWDMQDCPSKLVEYLPKIEGPPSAYMQANRSMTTDNLLTDFQMLASILAADDIPSFENISSLTLESRDDSNNCEYVYDDGSVRGNTSVKTLLQGFLNSANGKNNESKGGDNFLPSTEMVIVNYETDHILPPGDRVTLKEASFYG